MRLFDKLSNFAPFQFIGNISYSLYLFHWVIISLFTSLFIDHSKIFEIIFVIVFSLILASFSYYFVEKTTKKYFKNRRITYAFFFISLIVIFAFTFASRSSIEKQAVAASEDIINKIENGDQCIGARGTQNLEICPDVYGKVAESSAKNFPKIDGVKNTVLAPLGMVENYPGLDDEFNHKWNKNGWGAFAKVLANPESDKTALLIGNSHAASFSEPVMNVYSKRGYRVELAYASGFLQGTGSTIGPTCLTFDATKQNTDLLNSFYDEVVKKADVVIIAALYNDWEESQCPRFSAKDAALKVMQYGKKLNVIQDNFTNKDVYDRCKIKPTTENCSAPKNESEVKMNYLFNELDSLGKSEAYNKVKTDDFFCDNSLCYYYIGGMNATFDYSHLTSLFSQTLTSTFDKRLE